jgi:hypothetical protein
MKCPVAGAAVPSFRWNTLVVDMTTRCILRLYKKSTSDRSIHSGGESRMKIRLMLHFISSGSPDSWA